MARKRKLNALGEKERRLVLPIGKKEISVFEYVSGIGKGLCEVRCSIYPNLAGLFINLEKATERAYKIKEFHERQLDIVFVEKEKEE